jgi:prepilin-type N-terminal cleavage/methylation domain-containing protein
MSVRSTSMRRLGHRLGLGLVCRQQLDNGNSTDQGLTLLECLVAIVVVSITMVSITPPIFWATATRVQNRRAEQAQALAQAQIDQVRTLVERGSYKYSQLPPAAGANIRTNPPAAPSASTGKRRAKTTACNQDDGVQPTLSQFAPVDTQDVNAASTACQTDFLVQTFRSDGAWANPATSATEPPDGFVMGVRVYSAVGLSASGTPTEALQIENASLRATSGLGNQRTRPLAVLYAVIVRNNSNQSLPIYRTLCQNTPANGC